MRATRPTATAVLLLAIAVVVAGCATSGGSQPAASLSASTSLTAPPRMSSAPASGAAASTAAPPCPASALVIGQGSGVSPATGENAISFQVTNRGSATCAVLGYPGVILYDGHGAAMGFHYADGGGAYVTSRPPVPVILAPSASGYILVAKYRCDLGRLGSAAAIQVSLTVTDGAVVTSRQALGGAPGPGTTALPEPRLDYCRGGPDDPGQTVHLSPVEPTLAATDPA